MADLGHDTQGKVMAHSCLGELVAKPKPSPEFLFLKLKLTELFGSQNQHLEFPKAYRGN